MFEISAHSDAAVLAPEYRCDEDVSVCRGMEGQLLGWVSLNLNSYNTDRHTHTGGKFKPFHVSN